MPLKAGRPGPTLSNAAAPAGVAASGPGSDGAGVLPPPLGHGYDGIYCEGAQCATHRVVQSRCHTEEVEPGRFVRRFEKTEQLLRDCVGRFDQEACRDNSTLLRRFTETIDGKKKERLAMSWVVRFRGSVIGSWNSRTCYPFFNRGMFA